MIDGAPAAMMPPAGRPRFRPGICLRIEVLVCVIERLQEVVGPKSDLIEQIAVEDVAVHDREVVDVHRRGLEVLRIVGGGGSRLISGRSQIAHRQRLLLAERVDRA